MAAQIVRHRRSVSVSGVGGEGKQRIVDIIDHRQPKPARFVEIHLDKRRLPEPVEHQMRRSLQEVQATRNVLVMSEPVTDLRPAPDLVELLDTVLAALWQVEIADHGDPSPPPE